MSYSEPSTDTILGIRMYETERLLLKVATPDDVAAIVSYLIRNRDFLMETEPPRDDRYYSFEYQAGEILHERKMMENGQLLKLWIVKRENPTQMIGTVSFNTIIRGPFQSCFLGYRLDYAEVRRGYMTEALREAIRVLFGECRLHRVEANILPGNGPSLRVVERLGFHYEGLALRYLLVNGKWEDHIRMVLLNDRWAGDR